jgi:hypothetical protein
MMTLLLTPPFYTSNYLQATATYPVDAMCSTGVCAADPEPSPKPTLVPTTTNANATNTTLVPNTNATLVPTNATNATNTTLVPNTTNATNATNTTEVMGDEVSGWLYDVFCLGRVSGIALDGTSVSTGVHEHTVGCLLVTACIDSGYFLQRWDEAKQEFMPGTFFTQSSTPRIVSFLNGQDPDTQDVYVTVTGTKEGAELQVAAISLTPSPPRL